MKISYLFIATTLLCSSGCANQNVWVKDGASAEVAQKEFAECKYDSQKSSFVPYGNGISPISAGVQEGFQSVTLLNECMRSRGYYLTNRLELEGKKADQKKSGDEFRSAMQNKDYTKALVIINQIILQQPNAFDSYHARGNVYMSTGKFNDAIADYNKSISLGNKNFNVILYKANAFAQIGEYDVAIEAINHGLSINNNPEFYNLRAYCFNKKGEFNKAMEDCNKAIALDTNRPNFYKNRGLAYHGKLEYDKAIEQFNKSMTIDPAYMYAYTGRGETYLKMGKLENAASDFKKACELGDKDSCSKAK